MIARELEKQLIDAVEQYPVVFVTGPRQSGKSTLLKYLFSDYQYVSLEDLDNREFARNDPRSFLAT
ncbi:MAG: AAA family ATPase, partial [Bacteroidales bacterium]|nr:AAA family ATPase [Bacteroidales bacterium]